MQNDTQHFFKREEDKNLCDDGGCEIPPPFDYKSSFVDPPGELRCEPPPPSEYRDSHKGKVKDASGYFCKHWANAKYFDRHMDPIVKTVQVKNYPIFLMGHKFPGPANDIGEWQEKNQNQDDVYEIRLEVIEDCEPDLADKDDHDDDGAAEKKMLNPVKAIRHPSCKKLFTQAWKECNNLGRGGSIQAGCLRYSIRTKF